MTVHVQSPVQTTPVQGPPAPNAAAAADRLIADNRVTGGGLDAQGLRRDLDRVRMQDPGYGDWVAAAINQRLTPVERGELARAGYSVDAPDGGSIAFAADAPTVAQLRALPAGTDGRAAYQRLDTLYGDGDAATDDTAAIEAGLADLVASGGRPLPPAPATAASGTDPVRLAADLTQLGLDIVGIFEPTPFADGANALISIGRAIGEGDPWRLLDAGASAAGMLPYLGDGAKIAKIPRWAQTVSDAVSAVATTPALRSTLEPALREVRDAVDALPQGLIDQLPADAREAIGRMKTQLDEFFGAAPARFGDSANVGRTVRINGQDVVIGSAPTVGRAADGTPTARDLNGAEARLRQPATYDSRTPNPDGTVTYTRNGNSVNYDANGFPIFSSRADVFLPPEKIAVGSRTTHFTEANNLLVRNSDDQLRGAGFTDVEIAALRRGETPDNMTWHHHQEVGRMQLVRTTEHETFRGGHTGGWSLWGDAGRFTVG